MPKAPKGLLPGALGQIHVTFDFDPWDQSEYGNRQRNVANGIDFTGTGNFFIPFLNEGVLMTNVRCETRAVGPWPNCKGCGPTERKRGGTQGTKNKERIRGRELGSRPLFALLPTSGFHRRFPCLL